MSTSLRVGCKPAPASERSALVATSAAHFVHDGMADSLYVLLPMWAQALALNYTEVGSLKMAYSAAMALFQTPAGMIAERFGERMLLTLGTMLAGLAFAGMALVPGYAALFLLILLVGVGSSVQHPLSSSIISRAFSIGMRRSALGIYNFSGDLGKMIVAFGIAAAAGLLGWRVTVTGYGGVVMLFGIVLFAVLVQLNLGNAVARTLKLRALSRPMGAGGQWGITNKRGFALLCAIHFIDSASRTGTLTLLPFLLIAKQASPAAVGAALALVFAGGAMGKLACGLLADRIGILRTVVVTELATGAALIAIIPLPLGPTLVLMPVLGIALNGTSSVLYGTVSDFVRSDRQSRAFGAFYTLGSFAGGGAPLLFGAASDYFGLTNAFIGLGVFVLLTLPIVVTMRTCLRDPGSAVGMAG